MTKLAPISSARSRIRGRSTKVPSHQWQLGMATSPTLESIFSNKELVQSPPSDLAMVTNGAECVFVNSFQTYTFDGNCCSKTNVFLAPWKLRLWAAVARP